LKTLAIVILRSKLWLDAHFPFLVPRRRGGLHHLLLAVVLVALALMVRFLMAPVDAGLQYVVFFPAVTLAAVAGGFKPGLLATLLGAFLATYFFTPPYHSISLDVLQRALGGNLVFLMDGLVVSIAIEAMHRYRLQLAQDLEKSVDDKSALEDSTQQLKKSQAQLKTFIAQAPIAIAMFDRHMNYLETSGQWLHEYGRGYASLTGRNHYQVHPDLPDRWKQVHQQCLNGALLKNDEDLWIQADGSQRWSRWAVMPWLDEQGAIGGLIISAEEITERKRNERLLIESQKENTFLAELIRTSEQPLAVGYLDGRLELVNTAFEELTGYSAEELQGINWVTVLTPPEWLETEREKLLGLLHTGQSIRYEKEYIRKNGTRVPIEVLAHLKTDVEGQPEFYYAFITDITERRKVEEKLRRLNHTLQALSKSGRALIYATDETAYLQEICRIIVEDCGHAMAWIGFAESDAMETVRPVASAGFEEGYLDTLSISWADTERGSDPTGTAIRTGQVSQCRNMLTDPQFAPWRAEAVKCGYASSAVFPLLIDGQTIGALTLYSRESDGFPDDEVQLLKELADDLAFGITTLRLRAAHTLAEQALRENEQRMRLATEATCVGIWEWNLITNQIHWDVQMFRIYGVTPTTDEFVPYATWSGAVVPEDLPHQEQEMQKSIRLRKDNCREFRIRRSNDGQCRYIQAVETVRTNAQGQAEWLVGTNLDITEHKQAEQALRESQIDLNRAQAVAHIGSWRMNVRSNTLDWSAENYRIFGVPQGTPQTYESFLESVHPDDREIVDTAWQEALNGKLYDISHRIIADVKIKWVREQAELEFNGDGALLGAFGTTEDITDIKKVQDALQHERAFLRQVIDLAPSIIFVKDKEGRYLLGNAAVAKCYGTSPENLIGLTDGDFNPNADEVARIHQDDLDVISTCQPKKIPEEKVTHADGSMHWYSTVKIPLIENGNCDRLLGVAADITDRKQNEAHLAEQALQLQDTDRRKDEFLAMLAHELRNPLAPISNAVEILKFTELAPAQIARCTGMINRQVKHLTRLVDDLLDVSRISRGLVELKKEPLELRDFILPAVETCQPLIDSRRHTFSLALSPDPVWVEGDQVRLAQVVSNLLNNAAKYTEEGGHIELSVEASDRDVRIQVSDNGSGIDPADLAHLFDLFYQADRNLDRAQGGLGIGLSLVHNLVAKHGGNIQAFSAGRGQGSEFVIRLPRLILFSSTPPITAAPAVPSANKLRILVVDDNRDVAESLALLLESEGHQVLTAFDGIAALETARIERPDIILMDIGLPGLDGYAVAQALRQNHELERTMLIALTGYGQPDDRKKSSASGFDEHLVKPVDIELLRKLLASYPTTRCHESP
jgi:PAS domain S-box-containing protein